MKIFYSWQSDTPNSIGKALVRQALDQAVEALATEMELAEADRPQIDQDTQGVMGSPPVAETIFEKIRDAHVIVLDVTLTGSTTEGKQLINSNVAYELGYAHGHHGDHVLLKIMNSHYGSPENLPFDLKHRRWPVQFNLEPGASKGERKSVKDALAKEIAKILRLYAETGPQPDPYEPVAATRHRACYWREGEMLVRGAAVKGEGSVDFGIADDEALTYLRIWPDKELPALSGPELSDYNLTSIEPLLGRAGGYSYDRNRYGTIAYSGGGAGFLIAATQVFKNREIWGVERFILRAREETEYEFNFVPTQAFEEGIRLSLYRYLGAAEKLGYGDIVHVEAGMVNVDDFRLAMPNNYWERFWGPLFENVIFVTTTIDRTDKNSIDAALVEIYSAVFDAAGKARPDNLYGFPPKPDE